MKNILFFCNWNKDRIKYKYYMKKVEVLKRQIEPKMKDIKGLKHDNSA